MKKWFSFIVFILTVQLASAYIDSGAGGYLVSSIWPTIVTFFAVVVAVVCAFFPKYFVHPVKRFVKKNKVFLKYLVVIVLLVLLALFLFKDLWRRG